MLFALNMARITAMVCECESKMKRMYVRAKGGSGWEPVGWQCDCGCVCMDEGNWHISTFEECKNHNC